MTYFKSINTLEELRKQYRDLLKIHHPDNGGNVSDMQEINAEYDKLFKALKDKHESKSADGKESAYSKNMYDWKNDKALRDVLEKIIHFNGIEINLVGAWIWLDGNTYQYKEELKGIGFKWSKNRKKWYWNNGEYIGRGNKKISFSQIENKYGSTKFRTQNKVLLEA
jgi:curved DNA-binding protein CbpA